jgi:uncharacterized protein YeaO (DUF488 family)
MAVRVVQLGSPRARAEGLRLGTVRRPPRGVRKKDYARLDYFDLCAPSPGLVSWALSRPFTTKRWATYARRYRHEMRRPAAARLLSLLAALSSRTDFAVGCYCADEARCHRSLLRRLLLEHGATVV